MSLCPKAQALRAFVDTGPSAWPVPPWFNCRGRGDAETVVSSGSHLYPPPVPEEDHSTQETRGMEPMWVDMSAQLPSLCIWSPAYEPLGPRCTTSGSKRQDHAGRRFLGLQLPPLVPLFLPHLQPRSCVQPEPSPAVECRLLELVWPEASHPSPPPLPFLLDNSSRNLDQKKGRG